MARGRRDQSIVDDDDTKKSLNVLADATAEVVGRGEVYEAIVKVAEDGTESDFEDAREKFDDMDLGDRVRIRAQAIETLGDGDDDAREPSGDPGDGGELDWASQMMKSFPSLSDGLDTEK